MARDLNKVMLTGRLGKAVELRYTPGGNAVATFSVATNRPVKQADGNWGDQTEWFRVVAWDKLAERCANLLTKGRHVYIEGRLQTRKWTDQNGQDKYTTEVIATDMMTLDKKPTENQGDEEWSSSAPSANATRRSGTDYNEADELEPEDIPF
ncbi:MAG: single-stranded DNA-binding protein [Chloroflexi bacterium]|uniref:Single-stranded DNA-binding protein n=1 Tax=Candidatus Chlorohelix allophototropha TaxID=3003348 RepID=A0A8T7M3D8_9CHLR|nr:single-stranded DNA-binding protein [Chloroflexota bacterium]WJW67633.1 single-stranded DNA-binding protein [Chloroflexota bacterium L227-S17]